MSDTPIYDHVRRRQEFLSDQNARYFTNDEEPPFGEHIELVDAYGTRLTWNGKRWYNPEEGGSLQTQECWPPYDYGDGPWKEVQ